MLDKFLLPVIQFLIGATVPELSYRGKQMKRNRITSATGITATTSKLLNEMNLAAARFAVAQAVLEGALVLRTVAPAFKSGTGANGVWTLEDEAVLTMSNNDALCEQNRRAREIYVSIHASY
jgi:hypothetical protein